MGQFCIGVNKPVTFHYRADGRPDQWRGLAMQYDSALGMVSLVDGGGEVVRYARGLNNQRVLRQQGSDLRLSFQGAGHVPLMIWENGQPRVCIWAADGLAAVHDGTLHYPVTDHQHTVWAVTDSAGAMQASFDYLPFGGLLAEQGSGAAAWLFRYAGKEWDAGTGLYDFGARLYDPALLRFVTPDPARQYASPYVFASNNPLNMMDPSGNISVWAQVGIGAAMVALAIFGIALSIFTAGAAAPAVAAGEAALAGAGEGVEVGVEVGVETSTAAASEVSVGASPAAEAATPLTTAQAAAQNALPLLQSMFNSGVTSTGTSGLVYDVAHGRDFTWKGLFIAMGAGAVGGLTSGGIGGLYALAVSHGLGQGMNALAAVAVRSLVEGASGLIGSDVSTLLADAVTGQKVTGNQLLLSSATGFGIGALSGAFSDIKAVDPSKVAVGASEQLVVRASSLIHRTINIIKTTALSNDGIMTSMTGGFFLSSGYVVWGVYEKTKS